MKIIIFLLLLATALSQGEVIPPTLPQFQKAYLLKGQSTYQIVTDKRTIQLVNVPDIIQSTGYTCGPASLKAVLRYFHLSVRQSQIQNYSGTIPWTGTGPIMLQNGFNKIVKAYGLQGTLTFQRKENMSISQLEELAKKGEPVIVLIQVFKPPNDPTPYSQYNDRGHYVVLIGMDDQRFYFQDPRLLNNVMYIPKNKFQERWHDYLSSQKRLANKVGLVVRYKNGSKPKGQAKVDYLFS